MYFSGETVARAIRRLAGGDVGKKRQQAQRKMQLKVKKGQVMRIIISDDEFLKRFDATSRGL